MYRVDSNEGHRHISSQLDSRRDPSEPPGLVLYRAKSDYLGPYQFISDGLITVSDVVMIVLSVADGGGEGKGERGELHRWLAGLPMVVRISQGLATKLSVPMPPKNRK